MNAATDSRQDELQCLKPAEAQPETFINPHLHTAVPTAAQPNVERQQTDPAKREESVRGCYERLQTPAQAETNIRESRMLPVCERSS